MSITQRHIFLSLLLGPPLACGPVVSTADDAQSSTETDAPPGGSTTAPSTSSTAPNPSTAPTPDPPPQTSTDPFGSTGGSEGSGGSSSDDTGGCGFLCDPTGEPAIECNTFEQDCPEGEKCTPWANDGGWNWNATRCSPIQDNPGQPGEPCTVEGSSVSGIDSCDLGSMCWNVDTETNTGTCTPHCVGSLEQPSCTDPDRRCTATGDSVLNLCLPSCQPLMSTCPPGQGCYPLDDAFVCAYDGSQGVGGPFQPCAFTNACAPGNICVVGASAAACDSATCCSPLCDLQAPVCPDATVCFPWYDEGTLPPGGDANVGYCADADWDG